MHLDFVVDNYKEDLKISGLLKKLPLPYTMLERVLPIFRSVIQHFVSMLFGTAVGTFFFFSYINVPKQALV